MFEHSFQREQQIIFFLVEVTYFTHPLSCDQHSQIREEVFNISTTNVPVFFIKAALPSKNLFFKANL
jgi:hypothetical protein